MSGETSSQADLAPGLELKVCRQFVDLQGREAAWNRLVDASIYPNVFQRWEWVSTWWKWFGEGCTPHVICVSDGLDVVAILPLYGATNRQSSILRRTVLRPIGCGGPTCPEYLGPILHRGCVKESIEKIVRYLASVEAGWDVIALPDVPPDDQGTRSLVAALRARFPAVSYPGEVCPYLCLPGTYDALLERVSSNRRQQERRRLRRAAKDFRVRLETADTLEAIATVFPRLVQLNVSSRGRSGEVGPFARTEYAGFHRDVMQALVPKGIARVFLLTLDDMPVAFQYGFVFDNKYSFFQGGFDCRYEAYSPGDVLFQLIFEQLIGEQVGEFDYLRGDEAYKRHFADKIRSTDTTLVYRRAGIRFLLDWMWRQFSRPLRSAVRRRFGWPGAPRRRRSHLAGVALRTNAGKG